MEVFSQVAQSNGRVLSAGGLTMATAVQTWMWSSCDGIGVGISWTRR